MKRGVIFKLPNEYGTFLGDVLKPVAIPSFHWRVGSGESYKVIDNGIEDLFPENKKIMHGHELKYLLENNEYYLIFADLQAYSKGKAAEIDTYEEFVKSDCELVLLVADSCDITIYSKDKRTIELLYKNAWDYGFEEISYITDENDTRTKLSV